MKVSISLEQNEWEHLIKDSGLWGTTSKEIIRKVEKQLTEKMSRSNNKTPEPVVLSPLEFSAEETKIFCISSADKEPIEALLPIIGGKIVIFTSHVNTSGINHYGLLGDKKDITIVKVHDFTHAMILLKRFKNAGIDHFILDRWDMVQIHRTKMKAGALRNGAIGMMPSIIGKANFYFTTMMGDPGLFEAVDKHVII